jgi:hypothetical protein
LLVPRSQSHPDTLSPGTLHSQNIARLWLHGRAGRKGLSSKYSETPFPSPIRPDFNHVWLTQKRPLNRFLKVRNCNYAIRKASRKMTNALSSNHGANGFASYTDA